MMRNITRSAVRAGAQQQVRHGSTRHKVTSVEDAVRIVRSGDTVTIGGFVCQATPEELCQGLEDRFMAQKDLTNLTAFFGGGPGDYNTRGINHFGHEGLTTRAISSHYGQVPMLGKLALANKIKAYIIPLGSISRMTRATAGKLPGHITTIGLGTLADPKNGGGKVNAMTTEDIVHPLEILGKKYLFYQAQPVNVAFIRGTTGDTEGNITMEHESLYCDMLVQAMAARACGGVVIAQVKRITAYGGLHPRTVKIPGSLVDCVVVAKPENHWMSFNTPYNAAWTAEVRQPPSITTMPLNIRKMIARRGSFELLPNQIVNLGIGMPEGVASVADEESVSKFITLTTEPGIHGGVGARGHDFGPAVNYDALLDQNQQFDFYNGGGLDVCFLGMAQVTLKGDVNVTRVGAKLTGPGGFVDISQSTRKVCLCGTFTASGLEVKAQDGKLTIVKEGKHKKFVKALPEVTFSGEQAVQRGQSVLYITERAVFMLTKDGLELIEVAPGIDLKTQVLDLMDFKPIIKGTPRIMDPRIFTDALMGLKDDLFGLKVEDRLHWDKDTNTVYMDLHGVSITQPSDAKGLLDGISKYFREVVKGKANAVVNYDGFDCRDEVSNIWVTGIQKLNDEFYLSVTRYTRTAFLRHKMGDLMKVQDVANVALSQSVDSKTRKCATIGDVLATVKKLGIAISATNVQHLFKRHDADGNGFLDEQELNSLIEEIKTM